MSKVYKTVVVVVVLAVVGYAGWNYYQSHRARRAGLLTEDITHQGDTWKANFTARIPATETAVFNAIRNIESTHGEQVKAVRVVSQSGDTKTVDMDIAGPAGQAITTRLEFNYQPEQRKISYHTINNPLLDTHAEYQFSDEGSSTFVNYHETTKLLQSVPVPDGVIKQVIRGIFVAQLESLKKALNISVADETNLHEEEF